MEVCLLTLFHRLADEVGLDPFDRVYCLRRIRSEGVQFLTITLPKLSKAVLKSIEIGFFERPTEFAWKGRSLRNFRSFLKKIFDDKGVTLVQPCPYALRNLRQLCEYFYKLNLDFSQEQLADAESKFINTELELRNEDVDYEYAELLRKDLHRYFSDLQKLSIYDVLRRNNPRNGPGSFSVYTEGYEFKRRAKYYVHKVKTSRDVLFAHKAISGFFKPYPAVPTSWRTYTGEGWNSWKTRYVTCLKKQDTSEFTEILFVPKDSRGPRVIGREPMHNLKLQLSFFDFITSYLEDVTDNRINFRDQSINQKLVQRASIDRSYSTLDLKEASDRIDHKLVSYIFKDTPMVRWFVNTRSTKCVLPSGKKHQLTKLSGMGSGLTFPIMSFLIFLTICHTVSKRFRVRYTSVMKEVYVYGDDIVIPTRWFDCAVDALKRIKLKVNTDKSFTKSHFRESCGSDFFYGVSVAPVRLKLSGTKISIVNNKTLLLTGNLSLLQVERHCRELMKNNFEQLADYLYSVIERKYGQLPSVSGESPIIGRYVNSLPQYRTESSGLFCTIKCIVPVPVRVDVSKYMDPYRFLSEKLRRVENNSSSFQFDTIDAGSPYGTISEPRAIAYKRKNVSSYRLMG